jgi:two-component system cell cycle sensor histidine kinase PleC
VLLIVDRAKDTTVKKKPAVAEVRPADERGASRELNVTAEPVDAKQAIAPGGEDRSALADVLARLAHELRTPISAIVTLSELLRCERYGPLGHPKYVEYVDSIRTGADHALAVLAQTLQDAVEADLTGPAIEESVDVRACLEDCLRLVEPDATSAGVVLERAYGETGERVRTDPAKLRQIVINILKNAQKFSPDGGRVRVGYRRLSSGEVEIFVRDNGLGMARSDLSVLMDAATSGGDGSDEPRGAPASGLGFAIIRTLAKACGARFKLTSARSRGTLARLRFPVDRVCVD